MNITKYETLAAVVELGSLTRAAAELGCTQSAVSHAINSLEQELGFAVLTRSRAGVKLTEDGRRLMPAVRNVLTGQERLSQIASSIRGLDRGTVRIGTFTSVGVHWLPGIIKAFQHDYPGVDIKLLNGDYFDVEQWLIVTPSAGRQAVEDRLLAILPAGSRFASYPKFPLRECETEPFITLLESSNHDARRALEAAGVKPNIKYSTKDDYAIIAMVEQGLGVSIMPELLLRDRHENIVMKELVPPAKRVIGLAIPEASLRSPATRRFEEYIVSWVRERG